MNPVRAGLVVAPEAYRWGSCRFYFRQRGAPDWLAWEEILREHGSSLRTARQAYRRFLQAGIAEPPASPLAEATASTLLGSSGFVDRMRAWVEDRLGDREVPAARQLRAELQLEDVVQAVYAAFGVPAEHVRRRGSRRNRARLAAVYLCRSLTRRSVREMGTYFGGVTGQAVSNLVGKLAQEHKRDQKLNRRLSAIEKTLRQNG